MRGKVYFMKIWNKVVGITPAYAGKRIWECAAAEQTDRITPAYAGKSTMFFRVTGIS